jgi:GT2 family glycosyltransferase
VVVRVVVVLDGSDDGSEEALRSVEVPYDLEVLWQPKRGPASARNAGLAKATTDGLVLFLDDDLTPSNGLLTRHCHLHAEAGEGGRHRVFVGPCLPAVEGATNSEWQSWWIRHYKDVVEKGRVDQPDFFTAGNVSGPASVFRDVGGFDEDFTEYGGEDYELGARLLAAGVAIGFDREAVAWHHHQPSQLVAIRRERSSGRNSTRIVQLHPELLSLVFPSHPPSLAKRMVGIVPVRSARWFAAISHVTSNIALRHPWIVAGRTSLALQIAHTASFAAGVAETGPQYLDRYLERDRH